MVININRAKQYVVLQVDGRTLELQSKLIDKFLNTSYLRKVVKRRLNKIIEFIVKVEKNVLWNKKVSCKMKGGSPGAETWAIALAQ